MSDKTDPKQATANRQAVDDAWDQVGVTMETIQETWSRLANRNFGFWKEVASTLQAGPVNADTLSANTARAMTVAMETAQDLWLTAVEPPRREVFAQTLPTAFLYFAKNSQESGGHGLPDPVHIEVHHHRENLAPTAEITISGNPDDPDTPAAGALAALRTRLRVRRDGDTRTYVVEALDFGGDESKLVPGTYVGLIYLRDPALPLANLRVLVE